MRPPAARPADPTGPTAEVHILSGGIDSTSVLYRRLGETPNAVHVLHVLGDAPAALAATRASREIVAWLAGNLRAPLYREIAPLDMTGRERVGGSFAQCGFAVGAYVVEHPFIATVVQGTNGSPADQAADSLARNRYREGVCAAVCAGRVAAPVWIYPNFALPKVAAYRLMPAALGALCWTCASPIERDGRLRPCGACMKCREFQEAQEA